MTPKIYGSALLLCGALLACRDPGGAPPLRSDGASLRDGLGRAVILRGVGVAHPDLLDVSFSDGRAPRAVLPPFDDFDGDLLRRRGFNAVRLALSWSALQPEPGRFADDYLERVAAVIDLCQRHDLLVFLELHQDGFSKELCQSGAPRWALPAPGGPLTPGGPPAPGCASGAPVLAANDHFFSDAPLQAAYRAMLQHLARRFQEHPAVLGYGLWRAPETSAPQALAFATSAAAALRQSDPGRLIVFQPPAARDRDPLPAGGTLAPLGDAPFPVPDAVYGVRIDSPRSGAWEDRLDRSIYDAREEALSHGVPLLITEHAADADLIGLRWITRALDGFDAARASSLAWPLSPSIVVRDFQGALALTAGGKVLAALDRPYAPRIGGDLLEVRWDAQPPPRLTLRFRERAAVPTLHEISWYAPRYGPPAFTCDGRGVTPQREDTSRALYVISCGGGAPEEAHTIIAVAAP